MKGYKFNATNSAVVVSLILGLSSLFDTVSEDHYLTAFIMLTIAGMYVAFSFAMKKNFSLAVLIAYVIIVTFQISYIIYLENKFWFLYILYGVILIYEAIKSYRLFVMKRNISEPIGDQ